METAPDKIVLGAGEAIETLGGAISEEIAAAAATVLNAFTLPQPKLESNPGEPKSSVFCSMIRSKVSRSIVGRTASAKAATPAAIGDANEVPYHCEYVPPFLVVKM